MISLAERREINRRACKKYRKSLRKLVFDKLGGRCSNPSCMWINQDNTKGCTDSRCLQIDHVFDDGYLERRNHSSPNSIKHSKPMCETTFLKKVFEDTENRYQLLCANCNWIKRQSPLTSPTVSTLDRGTPE